jgi:hypothetical protein
MSLIQLVESERALVLSTEITIQEIEKHIKESVAEARAAAKDFRKRARVLSNLKDPKFSVLLNRLDAARITDTLLAQFAEFRQRARVCLIPLTGVSIAAVMERYFMALPPFGGADKKHEFPDAFALAALTNWCKPLDQSVYVISTDGDMKSACSPNGPLFAIDKLEQFLDMVVRQDTRLAEFAESFLRTQLATVEKVLRGKFEDSGFVLIDEDGDVENVEVQSISIEEPLLISVEDYSANYELTATVTFLAEVFYDDMETASYDSEDKVLIPWRRIHKAVEQTAEVTAEIQLDFDIENPDDWSLSCRSFNRGSDIEVQANESEFDLR